MKLTAILLVACLAGLAVVMGFILVIHPRGHLLYGLSGIFGGLAVFVMAFIAAIKEDRPE
jgi:hypothetical protein